MMNKYFLLVILFLSNQIVALSPTLDASNIPPVKNLPPSVGKNSNLAQLIQEYQPDLARENRIVSQVEDSIIEGDTEFIKTHTGREVFAIYTQPEAEDSAKAGIIVLHSRGFHANWETVVKPVRVELANKNYDTLSIQMPVLEKSAKYYDYVSIFPYARERIQAGIDFFKGKGYKNIIIIAHGCGAHMMQDFFDKFGTKDITAFVGIGMGATDYKQKNLHPMILTLLDKDLPVLDVVAQYDFPGVLRFANMRKQALKQMKNLANKQVIIANTDHYYKDEKGTQAMVGSIAYWLDSLLMSDAKSKQ